MGLRFGYYAVVVCAGSNVLNMSAYDLETYTNAEVRGTGGLCKKWWHCDMIVARTRGSVFVLIRCCATCDVQFVGVMCATCTQVIAVDQDPLGQQGQLVFTNCPAGPADGDAVPCAYLVICISECFRVSVRLHAHATVSG